MEVLSSRIDLRPSGRSVNGRRAAGDVRLVDRGGVPAPSPASSEAAPMIKWLPCASRSVGLRGMPGRPSTRLERAPREGCGARLLGRDRREATHRRAAAGTYTSPRFLGQKLHGGRSVCHRGRGPDSARLSAASVSAQPMSVPAAERARTGWALIGGARRPFGYSCRAIDAGPRAPAVVPTADPARSRRTTLLGPGRPGTLARGRRPAGRGRGRSGMGIPRPPQRSRWPGAGRCRRPFVVSALRAGRSRHGRAPPGGAAGVTGRSR